MAAGEARRLRSFSTCSVSAGCCPSNRTTASGATTGCSPGTATARSTSYGTAPDGRTVHVVTDCRGDGGVTFLFDDVTEKLSLERQYHSLIESQRETLDHLNEGIAVFGADGRLQLFNPAFQTIWHLPDAALQDEPHLEAIIAANASPRLRTRSSGKRFAMR